LTVGNAIPVRLDRPFYNLQYLELAAVRLAALPPDFAPKLPNIRILNLSYNSIKDVTPLRGMTLLKRLFLIGNRISSLSDGTTETLLSLTELQVLDLRFLRLLPFSFDTDGQIKSYHSVVLSPRRKQEIGSSQGYVFACHGTTSAIDVAATRQGVSGFDAEIVGVKEEGVSRSCVYGMSQVEVV
jgi:hypothetical protein